MVYASVGFFKIFIGNMGSFYFFSIKINNIKRTIPTTLHIGPHMYRFYASKVTPTSMKAIAKNINIVPT